MRDKLVTSDPDPRPEGSIELQFFYLTSQATSFFEPDGQLSGGLSQREQLFIGSLGYGLSQDLDLTVTSGSSQLFDLVDPSRRQQEKFLGGPRRGGGLVDLELDLRWRFYQDPEEGLTMAVIGGPTLANDLNPSADGRSLTLNQGFLGADVAFVLRQDWGPASLNWEAYTLFPLFGQSRRFSELGTNLGFGYQLSDHLQPVLELNYARIQSNTEGQVQSLAATAGVVAQPCDWCKLTLGWQQTVWGRNTARAGLLIGGLSLTF